MDAARRQQLITFLTQLSLEPPAQLSDRELLPLEHALTHTSAGRAYNHEQLEFLGDAVLRLAASEFLEDSQPQLTVGERSRLRAQLVSDRWHMKHCICRSTKCHNNCDGIFKCLFS